MWRSVMVCNERFRPNGHASTFGAGKADNKLVLYDVYFQMRRLKTSWI